MGRRAVQATARLIVADVDGLEVARSTDPFDVAYAHAVAAEVLRLRAEQWRGIARIFISEYGAALKKGRLRGGRRGR